MGASNHGNNAEDEEDTVEICSFHITSDQAVVRRHLVRVQGGLPGTVPVLLVNHPKLEQTRVSGLEQGDMIGAEYPV